MRDATLPVAQIADKVGLSHPPCWKRIQKLEAMGVLTGRMAGEMDYLLRVAVSDMAAFDALYKGLTDAVPIKNVTSHFAMERMKFTTAYPVDTAHR